MRLGEHWINDYFDNEIKIVRLQNDLVYINDADNDLAYTESPMDREMFLRDFTKKENI